MDDVNKKNNIKMNKLYKSLISKSTDLVEYSRKIKLSKQDTINIIMSNVLNMKIKNMRSNIGDTSNPVSAYHQVYGDEYQPEDILILFYIRYGAESINNIDSIISELNLLSKKYEVHKFEEYSFIDDLQINRIEELDKFTEVEFEIFIAGLLEKEDFRIIGIVTTRDHGINILAEDLQYKIAIQVKHFRKKLTIKAIREAIKGYKYYDCDKMMIVTSAFFTDAAIKLAKMNNIELVDRNGLKKLIKKHY